jgi:hypothetical protein
MVKNGVPNLLILLMRVLPRRYTLCEVGSKRTGKIRCGPPVGPPPVERVVPRHFHHTGGPG